MFENKVFLKRKCKVVKGVAEGEGEWCFAPGGRFQEAAKWGAK